MSQIVQSRGLLQRLGGAVRGIAVGLLLMILSVPLMFWNEWTAVSAYRALQEGAGLVVSVSSDRVEPAHEGKLVHVVGAVTVPGPLKDPAFGVTADGATRLKRTVEMYQWKETRHTETRKKTGGGEDKVTTYSYDKVWSADPVDSDGFHDKAHVNPGAFPQPSAVLDQKTAKLGAFTLAGDQIARFSNFEPLKVPADAVKHAPPGTAAQLAVHDGGLHKGRDPSAPAIGDLRIRFEKAPAGASTVVAKQSGDGFASYRTANGRSLQFVRVGQVSAEAVFADAVSANTMMTWGVRGLAFLLLFGGLRLLFGPIEVLADIVPFVGRIAGAGITAVSFLLAAPVTLLVIAVAWIVARPLLGLALLLLVGLLCAGLAALIVTAARARGTSSP